MKSDKGAQFKNLPPVAAEYIRLVIKKMGYRRKVRQEVQAELIAHFEDAIKDLATEDRGQKTENREQKTEDRHGQDARATIDEKVRKIIEEFGDAKLLGILARRAKKRCRSWWRTAVVRCLQAVGLIVLYVIICSTPLFIGKPTIRSSYLDLLNATIERGSDPCENAQVYYDKAASLLPEDTYGLTMHAKRWPGDFNDTERANLVKWLADSKPALDLFRLGSQKPLCWSVYDTNLTEVARQKREKKYQQMRIIQATQKSFTHQLLEIGGYDDPAKEAIIFNELESLSNVRQLVYRMQYQILYEAYIGEVNAAVADCVMLHKYSRQREGKGLLTEQLVAIAIDAVSVASAFEIMERTGLSPQLLLDLQKEFEQSLTLRRPVIDFGGEAAAYNDIVQRCFTDNGKGNGRMLVYGLPLMVYDKDSFLAKFFTMRFPSRSEVLANIEKFYANAESRMKKTPWEMYKEGIVQNQEGFENLNSIVLLGILTPAYDNLTRLTWRLNCHCKAVITTAAILRYKKEKGVYPDTLEQLVETGYLKELPMDPYSDKTLVYRKYPRGQSAMGGYHPTDAAEDSFLLYTPGPSLIDHGGKAGEKGMWREDGDTIFWPVEKPKSKK